jgi:hypothetical protein
MPSSVVAAETPRLPGTPGGRQAIPQTGLESPLSSFLHIPRLWPAFLAASMLALATAYVGPRAASALAGLDDPSFVADRALEGRFDAALARREISDALAAHDPELAQSLVTLAADRHVDIDPALVREVDAAVAEAATMRHKAMSFTRGLIGGEPDDLAAFAGTAVGDLFVFGDIRDALREGRRLAAGEQADELVLGLAGVGIAVTAGTYATAGGAAPARIGLSIAKAARKSGTLSAEFAASLGRMLRQTIDHVPSAKSAPTTRAAMRAGVEVERSGGLLALARDINRVRDAAGVRAALDGLKIVKEPRDVTRIAKLAEKEGSRTRAILKVAGRAAIVVGSLTLDAATWLLGLLIAAFGFVSALKNATERMALRYFRSRRERRRRRPLPAIAAVPAHG